MTMVSGETDVLPPGVDGPLGPVVERVHMVGIGGAGMEGLARLLHDSGYRVTGSDAVDGLVIEDLRRSGVAVFTGHSTAHVRGADLLIYSAAVDESNPERLAAAAADIEQLRRAQVLGRLSAAQRTIAVAGTHGKTTTASLIAAVTRAAGCQPTVAIGGWVNGQTQSASGTGGMMIVEADEYDRSFLELEPWLAVVTNIETEHVDCYVDDAELVEAFVTFLQRTRPDGHIVINGDDRLCQQVTRCLSQSPGGPRLTTFGFADECEVHAVGLSSQTGGATFACVDGDGTRRIRLGIPGRHNVANALATCAVAQVLSLDPATVTGALAGFAGVDRRFQHRGSVGGVCIVDDYAHHPTEVAATLDAARQQMGKGRLVAVLQPHTYSRTQRFHAEFATALAAADQVWVTAVYAAREDPADGVESDVIVTGLRAQGASASWEADTDLALRAALNGCADGDWLIVMGAGDIGTRLDTLLTQQQV